MNILLLLGFISSAFAAALPVEDGVLVLDDTNFEQAISENSFLLVEFYAPWCGHCKSLAPEWTKAAKMLEGEDAKLAKVDATIATSLASEFEIKGFPTIKLFKNKKPSEYGGGRTATEIVNWVKKQSGPPATTVSTPAALDALREQHEAFVVGYFSSADSVSAKRFLALASADESLPYIISHDDSVKAHLAVSGDAVLVMKTFDDLRADMPLADNVDWDEAVVGEFIASHSHPLVQEFSQEGAKKIFSSPIQLHALFFTDKKADTHGATVETFKGVAASYRSKVLFVNVPTTETRVMEYFAVTEASVPALVMVDMSSQGKMKKFPYSGDFTSDSIELFVQAVMGGQLSPALKSEKAEPADLTSDVKVLRGESFNAIVMDNTKDALVEFYAPWCGHCKKLAPTWDELGSRLKDEANVVIAKMDSTANEVDVPGLDVKGYPTIYFFKGDDKAHPRKYEGGREVDDFITFLKTSGSNRLSHSEL